MSLSTSMCTWFLYFNLSFNIKNTLRYNVFCAQSSYAQVVFKLGQFDFLLRTKQINICTAWVFSTHFKWKVHIECSMHFMSTLKWSWSVCVTASTCLIYMNMTEFVELMIIFIAFIILGHHCMYDLTIIRRKIVWVHKFE